MVKKLKKTYPTSQNILTAQDLWQTHYQILSMISLKGFINMNVNTVMIVKI